jgi:tetratricopeptide (TPR) repeat protein
MKPTLSRTPDQARPDFRRSKRIAMAVSGAVALATLLGCAAMRGQESQPSGDASDKQSIHALPLTVAGRPTVSDYYALGRQEYFSGRYPEADAAFRRALELAPDDVDTLNALAVIHDRNGLFSQSAEEYERALRKAPDAPIVLANLGYSLLLQGRPQQALAPLERSLALQPTNPVTRANLEYAKTAAAIGYSKTAPSPAVSNASQSPPPPPSPRSPPPAERQIGSIIVSIQGAELRTGAPLAESLIGTRIEIANGNGVTGMARAMRAKLRNEGIRVSRVFNAHTYRHRRTEIVYAKALQAQAVALARELQISPRFVVASTRYRNIDLRLILGADLIGKVDKPGAVGKLALLDE